MIYELNWIQACHTL